MNAQRKTRAAVPAGRRYAARIALAAAWATAPEAAKAWSNHALLTWQAAGTLPEVARGDAPARTLDSFLAATQADLPAMLREEDTDARRTIASYIPTPKALLFVPSADARERRLRFLHALRINDAMPLSLFVQEPPGIPAASPANAVRASRARLPWSEASVLPPASDTPPESLGRVAEGESLPVADILATASSEPDLGLDIGLWKDNGTRDAALYDFGPQPFGNPALVYGSQAPFHMGFYHESPIVYRVAPFLARTQPEARIHLYMALSRFAFAHGEPYWGWRFAGWAVHYVQDLGQPYHVRVLPGIGTPGMLWINLLDRIGFHQLRQAALIRVTNRHIVLENDQSLHMARAYAAGDWSDPLLAALRDTGSDGGLMRLDASAPRNVVSAQSADAADALDAQITRTFPAPLVGAPRQTILDDGTLDMDTAARKASPAEQSHFMSLLTERMRQVGRDTRATIRAITENPPGPAH